MMRTMNKFMLNKIQDRIKYLPEDMREELLREAQALSKLGIDSETDYRDAFYIGTHAQGIAEELSGRALDTTELATISASLMDNRDLRPINTIFNFYTAVGKALNDLEIPIKKTAYPQTDTGQYFQQPFNRVKWTGAMQDIYRRVPHVGRSEAFEQVTAKWEKMEKNHFKNWLSYYEECTHNKYKTAQQKTAQHKGVYEVGNGAYLPAMLDANDLQSSIPMGVPYELPAEEQPETKQTGPSQNELVQAEIKTLIGRLNSAERIATKSQAISQLLGPEGFKTWLNALHTIKREIQTAPIAHVRSSTPQDLIIKRANILAHEGHELPAKLMLSLAQTAPPPLAGGGEIGPPPAEVAGDLPGDPGTGMGTEPTPDPAMMEQEMGGEPEPESDGEDPEATKAIEEFMSNVSGESQGEDDGEVSDISDVSDGMFVTEADLVTTAQAMPPPEPAPAEVPVEAPAPEEEMVVEEEPDKVDISGDDDFEGALKGVTVEKVIKRLESLSHVYGNRELARQLNIVDLMLGRLGLASYFPALAEAMKSALDSNQYVLTRLEEITSKLRGSMEGEHKIDLAGTPGGGDPAAEAVKSNLQQGKERDQAKKDKRQAGEEAEAAGDEAVPMAAPEAPVAPEAPAEELAGPARVEGPAGPPRV